MITKSLKALAKELQIPNCRPLTALPSGRDYGTTSGRNCPTCANPAGIEQDADVVMFIYREAYYLERQEPDEDDPKYAEWKDQMNAKLRLAEIIVSKQAMARSAKSRWASTPTACASSIVHRPALSMTTGARGPHP